MALSIGKLVDNIRQKLKEFRPKQWLLEFIEDQKRFIAEVRLKSKDLRKTNFELGLYHLKMGNLNDAILRFKTAKMFTTTAYQQCYFFLGVCYQQKGDAKKAKHHFNSYLTSSDNTYLQETRYCLQLLDNKTTDIKAVPPLLLQIKFNQLAGIYDQIMFVNRANTPQQQLFTMTHHLLIANQQSYGNKVLDLGCGTGVMGRLANSYEAAEYLVGVDFAENMINIAKDFTAGGKLVYNAVHQQDIKKFLEENILEADKLFDIIFASEVISYEMAIDYFAINCHKKLSPKGLLCLSFKVNKKDEDYTFNSKLEDFAFNEKYVITTFEKYGWKLVKEANTIFQTEEEGKLLILTKVAS